MSRLVISLITIARLLWYEIFSWRGQGREEWKKSFQMESLWAQIPEGVKRLNVIKKLQVTKT